jgi:hypothetical protein
VRVITDEVIAVLQSGGLTVGDGDGTGLSPPFVVVWPQTQTSDGSHADPWEDVRKFLQVTCVARSRQQAEWLADRCDLLLLNTPTLVVRPIARTGVFRDDTTGGPSQFKEANRYTVRGYR